MSDDKNHDETNDPENIVRQHAAHLLMTDAITPVASPNANKRE